MSVKCPRCHSLVATDAITGVPPEYCPYCDGPIDAAGLCATEDDASVDENPATGTAAPIDDPAGDGDHAAAIAMDAEVVDIPDDADPGVDDILIPDTVVEDSATTTPVAGQQPEETPPDAADQATQAASPDSAQPPGAKAAVEATEPPTEPSTAEATEAPAAAAKPRKRAAPSFARRQQAASKRPTPRRMWFIAAALALLAVMQIVLADRAQLAANERWRPLIVSVCDVLHCTVPPWREPAAFAMLGRDVRQHPYMPGALRVDATFRNNARWSQPWPELTLTLSDVNGRALGMRTFSPQEYLDKKVTQKEIGPGQSAAIRMEVMEPAAGVVSFSFDFH